MNARTNLTLVLILALAWTAGGCSQEQRLAAANEAFTGTLQYLTEQRRAGRIDDHTQQNVIAPARRAIDALLDDAQAYAGRGDRVGLYFLLNSYDRYIVPLLRERFRLEREEPRNAGANRPAAPDPGAGEDHPAGVPGDG